MKKTIFSNADVYINEGNRDEMPCIYIIEDNKVYMVYSSPMIYFIVEYKGLVGENYDIENGKIVYVKDLKNQNKKK
jgi:hypothetical protein